MANLRYVRPNRLRREAYARRAWIAGFGASGSLGLGAVHPILSLLVLGLTVFLWRRQERFLKGALGEDRALGVSNPYPGALVHLSDEYVVFNQVRVPNGRGQVFEADFIVVGPNGVFVVETKYYFGFIQGHDHEGAWTRSRPGARKPAPIGNPTSQVRRTMRTLSGYLAERGVRVWLDALVVFTHPTCRLDVQSESVPVLMLPELAAHIRAHRPRHPVTRQGEVIELLRELIGDRSTAPAAYDPLARCPGRPMPIRYFMQDFETNRVEGFMACNLKAALRRERWRKYFGLGRPTPPSSPKARFTFERSSSRASNRCTHAPASTAAHASHPTADSSR